MTDRLRVTREGSLALVTLTRADKHNGMDIAMLEAVIAAQHELRRARDVRCVVIHGDGPSFCAGLDVKAVLGNKAKAAASYAELWKPWRNKFQDWSIGWRELSVPVIAAVHGNCFGAGIQLALGADLRVARPDAKLSIMESKWGLIPDMGGCALLRELIPLDVAKELTFSGRVVSGSEALALKLVTHVDDDPLARARALAAEFETRSPDAIAAGKALLHEAWNASESRTLAAERRWQRRLLGSGNQRVAVKRNLERSEAPYQPRRLGR